MAHAGIEDTSAVATRRYFERLRRLSPAERAVILAGLVSAVRQLAESAVRAADPEASQLEVKARVAVRVFGIAVAERLFPNVKL